MSIAIFGNPEINDCGGTNEPQSALCCDAIGFYRSEGIDLCCVDVHLCKIALRNLRAPCFFCVILTYLNFFSKTKNSPYVTFFFAIQL